MDQHEYMRKITYRASKHRKPFVDSPQDDMHFFHFEEGHFKDGLIIYVNRNGNFFRMMRPKTDSPWRIVKTWSGVFDGQDWMNLSFRRDCPIDLARMASIGPQGRNCFEGLSLFPRELYTRGRLAAYRNKMFSARYYSQADNWTISCPVTDEISPHFPGQIWASKEASEWCSERFTSERYASKNKIKLPDNIHKLSLPEQAEAARLAKLKAADTEEQIKKLKQEEAWGLF